MFCACEKEQGHNANATPREEEKTRTGAAAAGCGAEGQCVQAGRARAQAGQMGRVHEGGSKEGVRRSSEPRGEAGRVINRTQGASQFDSSAFEVNVLPTCAAQEGLSIEGAHGGLLAGGGHRLHHGAGAHGVHHGAGARGVGGGGGLGDFERRPSDMEELIELIKSAPPKTMCPPSPSACGSKQTLARLKASYLEDGLSDAEAETLALMDMQASSPLMHVLTADLHTRVLCLLDIEGLLRCAAVSRDWRALARDPEVWSNLCRQRGWVMHYDLLGACEGEWWGDRDGVGVGSDSSSADVGQGGGAQGGLTSFGGPRTGGAPTAFERYWLLHNRRLWVWGMGEHGQLGLLDGAGREVRSSAMAIELRSLRGKAVVGVSCGAAHSVCVLASGRVLSWGCGKYGRLGHGTEGNESQPREIAALEGVRCFGVACGGCHNLAVAFESRGSAVGSALYVWGSDTYGECGLGGRGGRGRGGVDGSGEAFSGENELVAPYVSGGGHGGRNGGKISRHEMSCYLVPQRNSSVPAQMISQLQCGSAHSLVLLNTGMVLAFGRGDYGQQGNGHLLDVPTPTPVGLFDYTQPFPRPRQRQETPAERLARLRSSAAALPASGFGGEGKVRKSWDLGGVVEGGSGGGASGVDAEKLGERPVAKSVAAGGEHCFVIDMQGRLWAWGWNNYGQLGPLSQEKVTEPQLVELAYPVCTVAGGHVHSAVVSQGGGLYTFGLDRLPPGSGGRLGLGRHVSPSLRVSLSLSLSLSLAHHHHLLHARARALSLSIYI